MLPTHPRNRSGSRILDALNTNSSGPNCLSQRGIGRDNNLKLVLGVAGFGNKLFPVQQAFAAHVNAQAEFVIANIHVAASSIERREYPAPRCAACRNRFQQ